MEAREPVFENVPEKALGVRVAFTHFVEGEAVDQLGNAVAVGGRGGVVVGGVGVEELGQDLGLDAVDDGGRDGQSAELARLAQGLPDDRKELVLDAVVGAALVVRGDVLPPRAVLPVQFKQLQVLFVAPFLA